MRIPVAVLARVRGPALAAAVLGCSSAPTGPTEAIEPVPAPEPTVAVSTGPLEPLDAVDYDLDAETERLERTDRTVAAAETRRARRIDAERSAARQRARDRAVADPGIGRLPPNHWIHAACGRG